MSAERELDLIRAMLPTDIDDPGYQALTSVRDRVMWLLADRAGYKAVLDREVSRIREMDLKVSGREETMDSVVMRTMGEEDRKSLCEHIKVLREMDSKEFWDRINKKVV